MFETLQMEIQHFSYPGQTAMIQELSHAVVRTYLAETKISRINTPSRVATWLETPTWGGNTFIFSHLEGGKNFIQEAGILLERALSTGFCLTRIITEAQVDNLDIFFEKPSS